MQLRWGDEDKWSFEMLTAVLLKKGNIDQIIKQLNYWDGVEVDLLVDFLIKSYCTIEILR